MDAKQDRMTLVERAGLTFESFLGREFSSRFYSDQFLSGISARRLELHAQMGRAGGFAFAFATLIAFFDLIAGSSFSYNGLTLQITKDLSPVLSLFAAGAFMKMTHSFVDEQIIFRILIKLGSNISVFNFPLLLVDKAAINLWSEALTLRYFGPRSGAGQRAAFYTIAAVSLFSMVLLYLYAPAMVGLVAYQTFVDPDSRIVAKGIAGLALLVVVGALLTAIVCIMIPFKFSEADWIESTNQPTEAFAARMRAELAANDQASAN